MPAEPSLVEYAYRIADDVPHQATVVFDKAKVVSAPPSQSRFIVTTPDHDSPCFVFSEFELLSLSFVSESSEGFALSSSYEQTLDFLGALKKKSFR